MGFIDFDGERYWDAREPDIWYTQMKDWEINCLPSDASRRLDIITLITKDAEAAQTEKDLLWETALHEAQLRLQA